MTRQPTLRGIAWYLCGVFALLALMVSLITFHPDAQRMAAVLFFTFCGCAIAASLIAIWLGRLPEAHWVHESKPLHVGVMVLAAFLTICVILVL